MTVNFLSRELMANKKPQIPFPKGLNLRDHVRELRRDGETVYEFIGTDTFNEEWYDRQFFEIDAGREEEPTLYEPIYSIVTDANLPRNISVERMGPGAVILEEMTEGGEVKFATVGESQYSVAMRHWAVGLEYNDDLVAYNELWRVPIVERALGIAYNALQNHIHLDPIISYAYTAANQTPANTSGATTEEDWLLTLQDAIVASKTDTTNPRRGPYTLLAAPADMFLIERMLRRVPQEGTTRQSSAIDMVQNVIFYDGWSGTRGKKEVSYGGVTSGTSYLISQQYRGEDFQSFVKTPLRRYGMDEDITRLLLQMVWDTRFTMYADVGAAVEEITWP